MNGWSMHVFSPRRCRIVVTLWMLQIAPVDAQNKALYRLGAEQLSAKPRITSIELLSVPSNVPLNPAERTSPQYHAQPAGLSWSDESFDEVVAIANDQGYHCSGVLVSPRWVLTAKHCLPASHVLFGQDVAHALGVRSVAAHKTPGDPRVDLALLALDQPVSVASGRRRLTNDSAPPVGFLRAIGFGSTNRLLNSAFGHKRYVSLHTLGWGCDAARAGETGCDPDLEQVLVGGVNRDTCNGDSGGPLFEKYHGERRLVAITSRGVRDSLSKCGSGGIYVRLDRIAEWLNDAIDGGTPAR